MKEIKLRIIYGELSESQLPQINNLKTLFNQEGLIIEGNKVFHIWQTETGSSCFILGKLDGVRQANGSLTQPTFIRSEIDRLENHEQISEFEGRFVLIKICANRICEVWTDQFGRIDIYWQNIGDAIVIGTSLDLLPITKNDSLPDNVGVAHSLVVFGWRPAKQHTLYKEVHRLGINQRIRLENGCLKIVQRKSRLVSTIPTYVKQDLHWYADIFLESIRSRASNEGNIVYLSSGWDSTTILASLVHLLGKRKVSAVIGRMQYSKRSGVINQFEVDRAKAIAEYFQIPLKIIDFDYRSNIEALLNRLKGLFLSQQFASIAGINHWRLAEETSKMVEGSEVIFAGEISDGAHNLGFSQFTTIFHPASMEFREYSDKMASYLFGPTFLTQLQKGAHEQDPIWVLFKERNKDKKFDSLVKGNRKITQQLLASFFLRGGRMPLYSLENTNLLTAEGRENYSKESERIYIKKISEEVTQENLYASYLHLYNSFHWQGSTVSTLEYTAETHGLRCVLPFHDSAMIDFLSAMPETWGRGLDLNPTKYPLKWMLRNRIDYPNHLQVGPHSYTYDVNPNFTLLGEILFASSFRPVFFKSLKEGKFVDWLDSNFFDRSYIEGIVSRYLKGEELRGQEMNDLGVLAMHSAIGVYGQ